MKKQQPRKLQLSKETLIRLEDLRKIAGGQRGDTDVRGHGLLQQPLPVLHLRLSPIL